MCVVLVGECVVYCVCECLFEEGEEFDVLLVEEVMVGKSVFGEYVLIECVDGINRCDIE